MMTEKGNFIILNYTGTADGIVFDTTNEEKAREADIWKNDRTYEPMVVCIGATHIIPGFDTDLIGKELNTEYSVSVEPELAYGPVDKEQIRSAPVKNFNQKPTVGMPIHSDNRNGVIVNIIGKQAIVDFNHPLAGKTLEYTYTIEGIVDKPKDKVKGIFKLFFGKEFDDIDLRKGTLTITLPKGIAMDQSFVMGRAYAIHQIFEYIPEITDIVFKEVYQRPEILPETEETSEEPQEEPVEEATE